MEKRNTPGGTVGLVDLGPASGTDRAQTLPRFTPDQRALVIAVGLADPAARAMLLQDGFGDVLSDSAMIEEVEARARRVHQHAMALPRLRRLGLLRLDLLAREAWHRDQRLNLNPREFALLWHLSERPETLVTKADLMRDVWRMDFMPKTNSVAVHISRLRRKLADAGLAGSIEAASPDGYCLRLDRGITPCRAAPPDRRAY